MVKQSRTKIAGTLSFSVSAKHLQAIKKEAKLQQTTTSTVLRRVIEDYFVLPPSNISVGRPSK